MLSKLIVGMTLRMPRWFVRWVSRRYVAGATLDDAVRVMKRLESEGACFTIDVLGEEISSLDEAQYFLDEYVRVMHAIVEQNLDANLSIKPTAFGLLIDKEKGMENINGQLNHTRKVMDDKVKWGNYLMEKKTHDLMQKTTAALNVKVP